MIMAIISYVVFPYTTLFRSILEMINFMNRNKQGSAWTSQKKAVFGIHEQMLKVLSKRNAEGEANDNDLELMKIIIDEDRKSTRLNSSHLVRSYAVFCLRIIK